MAAAARLLPDHVRGRRDVHAGPVAEEVMRAAVAATLCWPGWVGAQPVPL